MSNLQDWIDSGLKAYLELIGALGPTLSRMGSLGLISQNGWAPQRPYKSHPTAQYQKRKNSKKYDDLDKRYSNKTRITNQ